MKTAIIYASPHHGNTKKLIDAIATKHEVTLIDATQTKDQDLSDYDLIGYASGIYFHKSVMEFAKKNTPQGKKIFLMCTFGGKEGHTSMEKILSEKSASIVGKYSCKGYDTYGPFKLMGGIAKGHPTDSEIEDAVKFYESISK